MLKNYFLIAWRQILKNKLYSGINILGLVVGLAIYIFGSIITDYEHGHDAFYEHSERIYTVGSVFAPTANIGVDETDGIYTAFAPFIRSDVEGVEAVARTVGQEFLVSIDDDQYYQKIRFADPELLTIFDFDYLEGDASVLDDPSSVVLTESAAEKFFGSQPALGETLTLDHDVSLRVGAIIADLRPDTHFISTLFGGGLDVIAPLAALHAANDFDLAGNFNNLSTGDYTYLLMRAGTDVAQLQAQIDGIFETHYPYERRDFISGLKVRSLSEANTLIWDAIGLPVLDSIRLLALLVLVVAIVNYTNLATAQSLSRGREIGLRKTMGASRGQLVAQFMVESVCVAAAAMLFALAALEVAIPAFNAALDKGLVLDYGATLPWLVMTTLGVGIIAGAYPTWLILQASPINALRDSGTSGTKSSRFRNIMLVVQFTISIAMLAMVLIMMAQNRKIEEASYIYPRAQIITMSRLDLESIQSRRETLRSELKMKPGIQQVSYSSHLPFEQSNAGFLATREAGDKDASFLMNRIAIDEHFLATYDIPLLEGRNLTQQISGDSLEEDRKSVNIIINELGLTRLGFSSPADAVGSVFYDQRDGEEPTTHTIVGVLPDQNFQGFHNQIKPTVFFMSPEWIRYGSIRVEGVAMGAALSAVEDTWDSLITDYPIQSEFLDESFAETFEIYQSMTMVLIGFATVALSLSMIGLFGMAAFMAQSRTREIGIRKVMGASSLQVVRLLIWQFSRPVMWALAFALPVAWLASDTYLKFFSDRLELPLPQVAIVLAGLLAVTFAAATVAVHALRVARASPIRALRYE